MTDHKPELPKLDEETLELMRTCGNDELDRTHIALDGREAQLLSAITKLAAMEELLREMRTEHTDSEELLCIVRPRAGVANWDGRCAWCRRVDALLEGK